MAENQASPTYMSGPLLTAAWLPFSTIVCLVFFPCKCTSITPHFRRIQKKFKILVYFLYLIELTQTILMTDDAFERFIYGSGTAEAMDRINLTWFSIPLVDGLGECIRTLYVDRTTHISRHAVAFLVQLQFAYRINLLRKSGLILALILAASLAQFGGALTTAIMATSVNGLTLLSNSFMAICFWLGGSAVADVTIALSMIYTLSRYDRSFQQTNDIVKKIIRLTVETGSITGGSPVILACQRGLINFQAIVAVIQLVLFAASPGKTYFHGPGCRTRQGVLQLAYGSV
ncbi:hypothetical protein VNI00_003313 [Paramarasmius palmivorus]|uniref:DUF6534 domain-containing protein n=1 Tax=Paramarasmius palmivorus TaxID=297713 RepID=A0AAW0DU36_9AGAR